MLVLLTQTLKLAKRKGKTINIENGEGKRASKLRWDDLWLWLLESWSVGFGVVALLSCSCPLGPRLLMGTGFWKLFVSRGFLRILTLHHPMGEHSKYQRIKYGVFFSRETKSIYTPELARDQKHWQSPFKHNFQAFFLFQNIKSPDFRLF